MSTRTGSATKLNGFFCLLSFLMVISDMVPLSEAFPWAAMRRQAKANLTPPTASFRGKTVLLVGATEVILSDAARILNQLGVSTLILAVRNVAKGDALGNKLRRKREDFKGSKLTIKVLEIDPLSFDSVNRFAATVTQLQTRINAIVIGSAIMNNKTRITADG
ncbi:uncharacterized protein LY79DRAFT_112618 [Colletotrichum navitas]|uniref:Uncharacterized protein n=1 Tax=Colletotrichum navitas TaxID=681940 RepID=A0AAD8PKX9_9PEZI|nr:uncharacterized protein LY79DRAFT_112618 [Colletotrichum navitas]KAK1566095.1 hypothetical protein LY79DRAFT_112618 [Colletotrichum navitas]